MRSQLFVSSFALVTLVTLVACSDEHAHEDPDVEACEHLTGGPFLAVTARMMTDTAPAIDDDHRAYTVTLPAAAIGFSGFVSFAASELGYYGVYLDQGATAGFSTSAGTAITPVESGTSSAACTEIMGRYMVPLEVGTTFILLSSPTVSTVNVVIEHHAEHEH
jgi:hypothetical protein